MLSAAGAMATIGSDASRATRDIVPADAMTANCSAITKPAPITAAAICAKSRVRFGPTNSNMAAVSIVAAAAAAAPMARTAAYAASHRAPPVVASTLMNGAAVSNAVVITETAMAPSRTEKIVRASAGDDNNRSRSDLA
jgi:hypothetical protein